MRKVAALALVSASLATAPALAQKVQPGLWETTMAMPSGGPQMQAQMALAQQQLAKLPPEQRKMMEDMLAKQGVGLGAGGNAIRYCLSKAQAENADLPQDLEGRCRRESLQRDGSTMRFKLVCSNPPSTGSGEIVFKGDKAYDMKVSIEHQRQGKPARMDMSGSARWISADCGQLKPVGGMGDMPKR